MRRSAAAFALMLGLVAPLAAQEPGPRADQLRRQLEQRFLERMRTELQMTPDQESRARAILGTYGEKRRALEQEERRLRQTLSRELRPGIAADEDSVAQAVDAILANRVAYVQVIQAEMKELTGVLTPIQRGQFFLLREQVLQRVDELRMQARARGMRPPGAGGPPPA